MSIFNFNTEEDLVLGLNHKDREAFNYLYDNYASSLYGVIIKIIGSQDEVVNDLLQETFVKIYSHIDQYDPEKGRLYTWMLNIARNTAIDYARSRKFKQRHNNIKLGNLDSTISSENLSNDFPVDHIGLESVTERLEKKYKSIIDLLYFKGYTHQQVSEILDIPLGTVKTRLRKALELLKKEMNKTK